MDNETRIKLLEAGYTKEEIEAGEAAPAAGEDNKNEARPEQKVTPNENIEDPKKDDAAPDDKKDPEKNEPEDPTLTLLKSLTKTVEGLQKTVKVLQDSNIKGATGGAPNKDTAEVVMLDFMKKL